ncbi:MAG: polyprenyl synthetase family protein [Verrucomicrobia bacterium]|nr:polyprenyl synthetase family protein [Verrucomicrobiota bacterium]
MSTQRLQVVRNVAPTHPQVLRRLVDERVERKLTGLVQSYHLRHFRPVHEALRQFVRRPGKRIRPLLFLQAAELFQPSSWSDAFDDLVSVAAGLEILHAFVLIHDDLIDGSSLRRALPSLHCALAARIQGRQSTRVGANVTIVAGDLLFALAQKCIVDTQIPVRAALLSTLLDYVFDTGYGEMADILFGDGCISQVSAEEIERMYWWKTTRYTVECPLVLAGIIADRSEHELRQLASAARPLGLAFQIQNDLREFRRGLENGASDDLAEGKKTVLLRTAYDRLEGEDRLQLRDLLRQNVRNSADVRELQRLVVKSNAVTEQEMLVEELFNQTLLALDSPLLAPEIRAGMQALLRMLQRLIKTPS